MGTLDLIFAARLAEAIGQVYADAEVTLLKLIADRVAKGLDAPNWAERQLIEVQNLRADVRRYANSLDEVSAKEIESAVSRAHSRGAAVGQAEVAAVRAQPITFSAAGVIDTRAVSALAYETINASRSAQAYMLRSTDDAYRRVIAEVSGRVITGVQTRQQAAQQALNNLARQGITGFVDARNRQWSASSYVEMALRTSTHRALMQGHAERLQAAGFDLVLISSHPNPAPMCQPYEGKVLSLSGNMSGTVQTNNALDGSPMSVEVYSSIAEARMNGFEHPNCKHSHTLLVPGASQPAVAPYDPQGYKDSQKQRYLERGVRRAREHLAVQLTAADKKAARARVKTWQDRAKEHSERTGIPRRLDRERVRVGDPSLADAPKLVGARIAGVE
ncbi:phage minor capsid protein [Rhodococcus qingshengii]|uniref:phage minor capsid protein n=1 Tax=Rhodococcus qingshengii TaxID=334542 RepID=UPI0037CC4E52